MMLKNPTKNQLMLQLVSQLAQFCPQCPHSLVELAHSIQHLRHLMHPPQVMQPVNTGQAVVYLKVSCKHFFLAKADYAKNLPGSNQL
jgi:hypothetical protein